MSFPTLASLGNKPAGGDCRSNSGLFWRRRRSNCSHSEYSFVSFDVCVFQWVCVYDSKFRRQREAPSLFCGPSQFLFFFPPLFLLSVGVCLLWSLLILAWGQSSSTHTHTWTQYFGTQLKQNHTGPALGTTVETNWPLWRPSGHTLQTHTNRSQQDGMES